MIRVPTNWRFRKFVLLAGLSLALLGFAIWPELPAVNQDEYLSLFPISWFEKAPEARSSGLYAYTENYFGHTVPMRAYPYVGALKAYIYAATGLPTTIDTFRVSKLVLVWGLFVLSLLACWQLSGGNPIATLVCLGWLLADVALVVLGVCDPGQQMFSLTLGVALFALMFELTKTPRWWKIWPIALVVLLGEWDRVNFLWFVASGLAASAVVAAAGPWRRSWRALAIAGVGCALGLLCTALLIPNYYALFLAGAERSIGTLDWPALWRHWELLFARLDPFGAYHIVVDTGKPQHVALYTLYRWSWIGLFVGMVAWGLCRGAWRLRRHSESARALLFHSTFMASLLYVIIKTSDSWAAHHMLTLKPFAYIGLGLLAAALLRAPMRKRQLSAALIALWAAHAAVNVVGFREMTTAPSIPGVYNVTWNQVDAWRAAARAPVKAVYALDWGVFYPGVISSPADQKWEMPSLNQLGDLRQLAGARIGLDIGLLFQINGPHNWILNAPNARKHYGIEKIQRFDTHPGEPWALSILNVNRWTTPEGVISATSDLVRNGDFADGTSVWRQEKWESLPESVVFDILACEIGSEQLACGRIDHQTPADSRFVQTIALAPGVVYEISAWARAEQVDRSGKGVHLVLLDHYEAESGELHGTSDWERLRFFVVNAGTGVRTVQLAARLGTWGSLVEGRAWFARISAQPVQEAETGFVLFEIGGEELPEPG